jgi:hypothetical protein
MNWVQAVNSSAVARMRPSASVARTAGAVCPLLSPLFRFPNASVKSTFFGTIYIYIYIYMCNTQTEMPLTNVYLWRSTTLLRNTRSAAKINSSPTLGSVRIGCDHRICCPTAVTVVRERYWTSSWITALGEEAHTTRSSNP